MQIVSGPVRRAKEKITFKLVWKFQKVLKCEMGEANDFKLLGTELCGRLVMNMFGGSFQVYFRGPAYVSHLKRLSDLQLRNKRYFKNFNL